MTASSLIGSSVDQVDDRYRNVSDAIVLFQRGNGPAALSMLRDAKTQRPELPPGEVLFAHLCFASDQARSGQEALQSAAMTFKEDPETWNMLADLQLRDGHLAEAETLFLRAIDVAKAYQGNAKRRTRLLQSAYAGAAIANERRGLWKDAESHLLEWQKLAPENTEIPSRLAIVLINTGRFDEATAMLNHLRELNPALPPAEVVLGNAYERLGKDSEARSSMDAALTRYPEDFNTQIAVGRWALGEGNFDLAIRCAGKAAALDPASFVPDLMVGQVEYLRGNFSQAEALFQKVYQAKPGHFDAINGLALSILAQKEEARYKLALEFSQLVARTNPDLRTPQGRQAATLLAWALYRNGQNAESEKLMNGVLASGPVSSEGAYFAAEIYSRQGNSDLALEAIQKALSSDTKSPYHSQAAALQEQLNRVKK